MTYTMTDAAYWNPAMAFADVIAGYLGGDDAYHVWTEAEWNAAAVTRKRLLPIWVPTPSESTIDARGEALDILSLFLHYDMRPGGIIALDLEQSTADVSYVQEMATCMQFFNYYVIAYGSTSTIAHAAPSNVWKWNADWTMESHLTPDMMATQWANGKVYDQSLITTQLYLRCFPG